MATPLEAVLSRRLEQRERMKVSCPDLLTPMPVQAADLFSNDYLNVASEPSVRDEVLRDLAKMPYILGSTGSRLLTGNTDSHTKFEARMNDLFGGPGCAASAAMLFNSGYDADLSWWSTVPQQGDAAVFDEYIHASIRDGMAVSALQGTKALYQFQHNSIEDYRKQIKHALKQNPNIAQGKGTLYIAVETLYSMDGDYAPLREIVEVAEELVPRGCAHIFVDEAHTTGLFGPRGRGSIAALGLEGRVHSIIHSFGKSWGIGGAVIMTSPIIRKYLVLYARPVIYTSSLPHLHVSALNTTIDHVAGPAGTQKRAQLRSLCAYFERLLTVALKDVPSDILYFPQRQIPASFPSDTFSPIFPLISQSPKDLEDYLRPYGYAVTAIPYPTVPKGQERIRVTLHSHNTTAQLDDFVKHVMEWVHIMMTPAEQRTEVAAKVKRATSQFRAML